MKRSLANLLFACLVLTGSTVQAADIVPNEIMMPGTQPNEVSQESPGRCNNCHAGYDLDDIEPGTGWAGAAMGNASRDPVFWATLAVVEQDFDGAGDLCIRCHSAQGWYAGNSTPTDGSGIGQNETDGIDCVTCHTSTNTNNSEYLGVMNFPFIANCNGDLADKCNTGEGFYGSGILSLWDGSEKLGPYSDAEAKHQWMQSQWHRHPDFCGTCHDVSNAAVGDLAPGNGAQPGNPHNVVSSIDYTGTGLPNLGGPVEEKAAFNNPPYAYGIVERTFSEYKSSPLSSTRVADTGGAEPGYDDLPTDLTVAGGSIDVTRQAAIQAGTGGDYEDGTPRYFTCQSCHMRPVGTDTGDAGGTGYPGCNKANVPIRKDLPRHDHTGGNYWFAAMAQYQDDAGTLRAGDGLDDFQKLAMDLGAERATKHLREAGSLEVTGNTVRVTNLTGHKLITGYPEGRRMWLNIKWYDDQDVLMREDGKYGTLQTNLDLDADGQPDAVETILDLDGANTEIYEAHYAMTKEWADTMLAVGYPSDFALAYDRVTGEVTDTLGSLAAQAAGSYVNTFHFALNNYISSDNRIPPYQMSYTEAQKRNALPVPDTRYPRNGDAYLHYDDVLLSPPAGAVYATIDLLYQGTSWEYMLFLQLANNGTNAFLGGEGDAMMDAWLNKDVVKSTGDPITWVQDVPPDSGDYTMVPPVVMASTEWGIPPVCEPTPGQETTETFCQDGVDNDCDGDTDAADSDCAPVCIPDETPEQSCFDGDDNDCDEQIDCADTADCDGVIGDPTTCGVGACQSSGNLTCLSGAEVDTCTPGTPGNEGPEGDASCNDGIDNDCDGDTDADDTDCQGAVDCSTILDKPTCNNDPACEWQGSPKNGSCQDVVACTPTETNEVTCTGGIDEDCDGAIDCDDTDCAGDPACQTTCDNDGVCDPGEDCNSCANDCAGVTGGKPSNRYCCGNGVVEGPEGDGSVCDGNY